MIALVVDDERRARNIVCHMIERYIPQIEQILESDNVTSAVQTINEYEPNIIFLDIKLGDRNSFEILDEVKSKNLNIIFVTAYNEYALKALKISAIDYVLKPIDLEEFIIAVNKALVIMEKEANSERLDFFLQNMRKSPDKKAEKIILRTAQMVHFVQIEDIIFCEAEGRYTTFYLLGNQKIIISKHLKLYETILSQNDFIRPHQSFLVNINHIKKYIKGEDNVLVCTDEHKIPVSHRKRDIIMKKMNYLS